MSPGRRLISLPRGIFHPAVLVKLDMGRGLYGRRQSLRPKISKVGAVVPLSVGELGPHLIQCGLGRGLPAYAKFHLDTSNRLATMPQHYRQT